MSKEEAIVGTADAWEGGELGADERFVRRAAELVERDVDGALGLQAISIRLPKATIDTYKLLAEIHGVGYQPLMRDAICRWADSELKQLLIGAVEAQRQGNADADPPPDVETPGGDRPMKRAA